MPAAWEGGHRVPRASELFRACSRAGIDVPAAIEAFHPPAADAFDPQAPGGWLSALKGSRSTAVIAERSGASPAQIRRWLSGRAQPRTHQLLALIDAMTGRATDLVSCLVDLHQLPSLLGYWQQVSAQRRLAIEHPWTAAIRIWLGTRAIGRAEAVPALVRALGIGPDEVEVDLQRLLDAGLVAEVGGVLVVAGQMTVDLRSAIDRTRLRGHWARTGAARIADGRDDLFSYGLVAVSRSDLERIRALQRSYWRELSSLVASSGPPEVAALVLAQIAPLDEDDPGP
ncbi:MAG TPA: hypothetical protein ENK18_15015 [Deltaproteobacteria bacterium]|nr:hypothetical protein [Deltaproteobacteria bacterium]